MSTFDRPPLPLGGRRNRGIDVVEWARRRKENLERAALLRAERMMAVEEMNDRENVPMSDKHANVAGGARAGIAAPKISPSPQSDGNYGRPKHGRRSSIDGGEDVGPVSSVSTSTVGRDEDAAARSGKTWAPSAALDDARARRADRRAAGSRSARSGESRGTGAKPGAKDIRSAAAMPLREKNVFERMVGEARQKILHNPAKMLKAHNPSGSDGKLARITVCVRKRPINNNEMAEAGLDVATCIDRDHIPDSGVAQVHMHEPKLKVDLTKHVETQSFLFDHVFHEEVSTETCYRRAIAPLVDYVVGQDGAKATCFAYGQTGSGKTYTMTTVTRLAVHDLFNGIGRGASPSSLHVTVSYYEVYGGKVFDLLNNGRRLSVLEDGKGVVQVVGLEEYNVKTAEKALKLAEAGGRVRTTGSTSANAESSRSHSVFIIKVRHGCANGKLFGQMNIVDLAGSERGADTNNSDRKTRMEGAEINKSLLALKECIRAMGMQNAHTPFRASVLTKLLRESLTGSKALTVMVANISPSSTCCEHTLNTLRYADRLKEIGESSKLGKNAYVNAGQAASRQNSRQSSPAGDAKISTPNYPAPVSPRFGDDGDDMLMSLKATKELAAFHQAVNRLEKIEDELVTMHTACVEEDEKSLKHEADMLVHMASSSADAERYTADLEMVVKQKLTRYSQILQKVSDFKKCLNEEEMASATLRNNGAGAIPFF